MSSTKLTNSRKKSQIKTTQPGSTEAEAARAKKRRYLALAGSIVVLLVAFLIRGGFSGGTELEQLGAAYARAQKAAQAEDYREALAALEDAYTHLQKIDSRTDPGDTETTARLEQLRQQMDDDKALWTLRSRPDAQIWDLIEQAEDDEDLGLYQRALDKLDEARMLTRELAREIPMLPADERNELEVLVDQLETILQDGRRRLAAQIRDDQDRGHSRDSRVDSEIEKMRLERERARLERELERARAEQQTRDNVQQEQPIREPATRDSDDTSAAAQTESTGTSSTGSSTSRPGEATPESSPTETRDVQTESMTKVDIDLGEELEMD